MIANRTLKTIHRETGILGELSIEIYAPYLLKEGMVEFPIHPGAAGCSIRVVGIGTDYYDQEVYGADSLQAIQLATNVESILKRISKTYDLYFNDGEPYFKPEST